MHFELEHSVSISQFQAFANTGLLQLRKSLRLLGVLAWNPVLGIRSAQEAIAVYIPLCIILDSHLGLLRFLTWRLKE